MLLPWMSERRSSWRARVVRRWCLLLTFLYYAGSRGRARRTRRRRSAWRTPGNKTKQYLACPASMAPESVVLFSFLRREGRRGRAGGGREDGEGRRGRGRGGRVGISRWRSRRGRGARDKLRAWRSGLAVALRDAARRRLLWRLRLQGLREIEFVSLVGVDRSGGCRQ